MLTAFGADLTRLQRGSPPIGLVQVARYANPKSSSTTALLAMLLAGQDRTDEALALLRAVPADDPLIAQIRDVQTRILIDGKRFDEAYRVAATAAAAPDGRGERLFAVWRRAAGDEASRARPPTLTVAP